MSQPAKILIVDDEEDIREALQQLLEQEGYTCRIAADGVEGLDALRREDFDVVLTDLRMPELDGIGLLAAMREARVETVPVVMTAYGDVDSAVEAMKLGTFEFLTKPVDLNKSIESTIMVARNEWKYVADLVMRLDPELPPVPCLAGDINQVVLNIIVNAAQAIAEVVGDGSRGKGTITVSTRRDKDWAEVRISDTGPGIPDAIRERVFDPFFTTKEVGRGTGQGLAISRGIVVEKLGGSITFETEAGTGTTFIVRLPIEET